jgi:uncharacterized Fe-S cluster-containing radical SAM superfamily protein
MTDLAHAAIKTLDPRKFRDPDVTADGSRRAEVGFVGLETLWFNTGTLCNLTCRNCYIESSPRNDRLVYLTAAEVAAYVDEAEGLGTREVGFTGGEPFMNPEIIAMLADCLGRGLRALVLTNAMRPMMKLAAPLIELRRRHGDRLAIRVSLDHYGQALHELERGPRTWRATMDGLAWLAGNGFNVRVAGRTCWDETEESLRRGYARLFAAHAIPIDADDPVALVLFPEMDARVDVPEITERCWDILGVEPRSIMCASSRMVIKRKDAAEPGVVPCTLLPYDAQFELGRTLAGARDPVKLNHPHCAKFCVLGGGSCSQG